MSTADLDSPQSVLNAFQTLDQSVAQPLPDDRKTHRLLLSSAAASSEGP
jgi:hypothetical protein